MDHNIVYRLQSRLPNIFFSSGYLPTNHHETNVNFQNNSSTVYMLNLLYLSMDRMYFEWPRSRKLVCIRKKWNEGVSDRFNGQAMCVNVNVRQHDNDDVAFPFETLAAETIPIHYYRQYPSSNNE